MSTTGVADLEVAVARVRRTDDQQVGTAATTSSRGDQVRVDGHVRVVGEHPTRP